MKQDGWYVGDKATRRYGPPTTETQLLGNTMVNVKHWAVHRDLIQFSISVDIMFMNSVHKLQWTEWCSLRAFLWVQQVHLCYIRHVMSQGFFKLYITSMATSHHNPSISSLSAPDDGHLGDNVLDQESIYGTSRTLVVYFPDSKGAV